MQTNHRKIVITGGGTGGHVFPGLTLAEEFRSRNFEVLYIGSKTGLENKLVPGRGFRLITLDAGGVKNISPLKILVNLIKNLLSFFRAIRILKQEKAIAVIGVGGYVSVPTCLAAFVSGIPVFIQEQNTYAGIANQFLGRLARKVFLGFEQAKIYFPADKVEVTGNPLRPIFFSERIIYPPGKPTLLVMGGSQGAKAINDAILEKVREWSNLYPDWDVIHQTGEKDFERVKAAASTLLPGKYRVMAFIEDIFPAYQSASLVVCRSGAMTVSELIQVKRPAVLVPYPRKGKNDQIVNALSLESMGAARMVEQGDRFPDRLWEAIFSTVESDVLVQMAGAYSKLQRPSSAASIAKAIETVADVQKN